PCATSSASSRSGSFVAAYHTRYDQYRRIRASRACSSSFRICSMSCSSDGMLWTSRGGIVGNVVCRIASGQESGEKLREPENLSDLYGAGCWTGERASLPRGESSLVRRLT